MMNRRQICVGLATSWIAASAQAETWCAHFARTRPQCREGVDGSSYQYGSRSASKSVVSRLAILMPTGVTIGSVDPLAGLPTSSFAERSELIESLRHNDQHLAELRRSLTKSEAKADARGSSTDRRTENSLEVLRPPLPEPDRIVRRDEHVVTSRTGEQLAPTAAEKSIIKLYQLDQHRIEIDHCSISQVSVQLHDQGLWVLSLRGDQHRRPDPGEKLTYQPRLHLKRNEFHILLRCLGATQMKPSASRVEAGRPILFAPAEQSFWVENGVPRWIRLTDSSSELTKYWNRIDRVELEFFYR